MEYGQKRNKSYDSVDRGGGSRPWVLMERCKRLSEGRDQTSKFATKRSIDKTSLSYTILSNGLRS
jgi:hypothetical protein